MKERATLADVRAAIADLTRVEFSMLLAQARKLCHKPEDAADLLSDTLTKLWAGERTMPKGFGLMALMPRLMWGVRGTLARRTDALDKVTLEALSLRLSDGTSIGVSPETLVEIAERIEAEKPQRPKVHALRAKRLSELNRVRVLKVVTDIERGKSKSARQACKRLGIVYGTFLMSLRLVREYSPSLFRRYEQAKFKRLYPIEDAS